MVKRGGEPQSSPAVLLLEPLHSAGEFVEQKWHVAAPEIGYNSTRPYPSAALLALEQEGERGACGYRSACMVE